MGRLKVARRAPSSSTSQVLRRADGKAVIASPCVKGALADSGLRQPSRLPAACSNVGERANEPTLAWLKICPTKFSQGGAVSVKKIYAFMA